MADSIWRIQNGGLKCKKLIVLYETWYSGIFEIGNYESELKIHNFKMADPIWRIEYKILIILDKPRY